MATQSRYTVQITPDWAEPLCLYVVAVAPPGERKSAVIGALTRPAIEYEAERRTAEAADVARSRARAAALEKAHQATETRFAGGKGSLEDVLNAATEAEQAKTEIKYPYRLLVDDATPEKLVDLMEQQGGSITVASAEGGIFDIMAGRYDRTANLDVYLKGHAGDYLTVDRIGRQSVSIRNPRLSMILTVQPDVIQGLMSNGTFRGRGLCGRYLYTICKSKVGNRDINPPAVPEPVKAAYTALVKRLLAHQDSGMITLSQDANEIRKAYQEYIEAKLGPDGNLHNMADWGGKCVGAMLRIAALLHATECPLPTKTPISADIMARATSIMECLVAHAMCAYGLMGGDQSQAEAKYLWRRIQAHGGKEITKNDLIQLTKGHFQKAESMEPSIIILEDMGYIRRIRKTQGRGRPKEIILVNPAEVK